MGFGEDIHAVSDQVAACSNPIWEDSFGYEQPRFSYWYIDLNAALKFHVLCVCDIMNPMAKYNHVSTE